MKVALLFLVVLLSACTTTTDIDAVTHAHPVKPLEAVNDVLAVISLDEEVKPQVNCLIDQSRDYSFKHAFIYDGPRGTVRHVKEGSFVYRIKVPDLDSNPITESAEFRSLVIALANQKRGAYYELECTSTVYSTDMIDIEIWDEGYVETLTIPDLDLTIDCWLDVEKYHDYETVESGNNQEVTEAIWRGLDCTYVIGDAQIPELESYGEDVHGLEDYIVGKVVGR